ncbi:GTP 3',8-cyclase MoaA [Clostridioides difficile]
MRDRFNREIDYLRISVTDNCNLRCIYCMEEESQEFLKSSEKITDEEIITIVKVCAKLGIKKIRLTGGEPLVRKGIVELLKNINKVEGIEEIYMTTNGILLADSIKELVENGLKGVNISLDSLREDTFSLITRRGNVAKVLEAIDKCIYYGIKVKINTVLVNEFNKNEIDSFLSLTIDKPIDVRFIELMPIGMGKRYTGVSNSEIMDIVKSKYNYIEEIGRLKNGGPAQYIKIKNSKGRIGFISAVSNCFCEECNRIRITADGFLKQCLHFNCGINLRDLIRDGISDEELCSTIENTIFNKPEKHLFNKKNKNEEIKFMNEIGG